MTSDLGMEEEGSQCQQEQGHREYDRFEFHHPPLRHLCLGLANPGAGSMAESQNFFQILRGFDRRFAMRHGEEVIR